MIELVNPDHDSFQTWRLANPRGFVLNAGRTLHMAECKHFGAMSRPRVVGQWDLGTSPKVCATSKEAITTGRSIKPCRDCKPHARLEHCPESKRNGRVLGHSQKTPEGTRKKLDNDEQQQLRDARIVYAERLNEGTGFEWGQPSCRNCEGVDGLLMVYPLNDSGEAQQPVKWCRACRSSRPHELF